MNGSPDKPTTGCAARRRRVPITVLAPERGNVDMLRRFAADQDNLLIASGEALAFAGLLGLVRVGRALVPAPDVTSRTPGCEWCQVRVDLIDAVRNAVLRRSAPKWLVVVVDQSPLTVRDNEAEDGPAGDVVTVVQTLRADNEIDRLASLDGVVIEVDGCAVSTRLAYGLALWNAPGEAALAIADRIIMSGVGLLTMPAQAAVATALDDVNRIGCVVWADTIDVDDLVNLGAWNQSPSTCGEPGAGRSSPFDAPGMQLPYCSPIQSTIGTVVLTRPGVLDPDATDAWLDQVVSVSPSRLLRLQAALCVSTREARVCVSGSRSAMRSTAEADSADAVLDAPHGEQESRESVVVLIGWDLDRCSLTESFGSIETAR